MNKLKIYFRAIWKIFGLLLFVGFAVLILVAVALTIKYMFPSANLSFENPVGVVLIAIAVLAALLINLIGMRLVSWIQNQMVPSDLLWIIVFIIIVATVTIYALKP